MGIWWKLEEVLE